MNVSKTSLAVQGQRALNTGQARLPVFDFLATALLVAALACVLMPQEFGFLAKFPAGFVLPVVDILNTFISWVDTAFSPLFRWCGNVLGNLMRLLDSGLALIPWQVVVAAFGYLTYRMAGGKLALLAVGTGLYVVSVGYWTETMRTLTLVAFALPIAALLGFAAGVLGYANRRFAFVVDASLGFMQTVPAFSFLVPMIVLFGFGPVPGVIASVLYAAPAMARNVTLGLNMTPPEVLDAAAISGCTPVQTFFMVKMPCALKQVLLGLNQTIMATLSMVIFAAAIGGFEDIGWEVLRAARRAEFGNGILAGIIITLLAILLDRTSAALATKKSRTDRRSASSNIAMFTAIVVAAWVASMILPLPLPNFRPAVARWLDATMLAVSVSSEPVTEAVKNAATNYLLLPLRVGLARAVMPQSWGFSFSPIVSFAYAAAILAIAVIQKNSGRRYAVLAGGLLLYTGFLTFPWFAFVGLATIAAFQTGEQKAALKVAVCLFLIGISGFWPSAMFSIYLVSAAVVACVLLGGLLGILASEIPAFSRIMRPLNDFLQTIPPFVILIPVIIFFKIGDFASFLAILSYSVAAMARYTEEGLQLDSTLRAMMETAHLGDAGPHPVIASAARELRNKSENERSGVLSTAMSFLGLYRDPVVAEVTRRSDWRISDIVGGDQPTTLYLVVPPSDINRTKPLMRLLLNQVGRRLTEDLQANTGRHRLLLMLDEFPALGRLDFFETALAFMAGYGLKSFLIAQSLNQIEKAYGPNNSILDNCHVRVSFATNDERTAKRVSDALGTATEMKAMKNYAGHRLSPWLGHLMVSRSETARQLLTPGEIMQLPPHEEIVMVAGIPPIRATKARYYEDARFRERVLSPPELQRPEGARPDDWTTLPLPARPEAAVDEDNPTTDDEDTTESERRLQPELSRVKPVEKKKPIENEFEFAPPDDVDEEAVQNRRMIRQVQGIARQVAMDPNDGMDL